MFKDFGLVGFLILLPLVVLLWALVGMFLFEILRHVGVI